MSRWWRDKKWVESNVLKLTQNLHPSGAVFEPEMLSGLPELAQKYLCFSIRPGAPLYQAASFSMEGTFSFGPGKKYQQLRAQQILCAPQGMVWKAKIGSGLGAFSGSDGVQASESWTHFALHDLFPVAEINSDKDHYQAAVGRMLAEAVFWTPAALLLSLPVTWETLGKDTVRAKIQHGSFSIAVDIKLDVGGCPLEACFQRWSNANLDKVYRYQPFGAYLSDFKEFEGITLPTHVEAGNLFGTPEYFPFYKIDVEALQWLDRVAPSNDRGGDD